MRTILGRWSHTTHERVPLDYVEPVTAAPNVMPDIQEYKSMITGERIKSRSDHRAHLRAHGCIEVGNEKMETKLPKQDRTENRARLRRQLAGMSDSQASQILTEISNMTRR